MLKMSDKKKSRSIDTFKNSSSKGVKGNAHNLSLSMVKSNTSLEFKKEERFRLGKKQSEDLTEVMNSDSLEKREKKSKLQTILEGKEEGKVKKKKDRDM